MDVAIGKMGRSIAFNPKKWGPNGGDNEPSLMFLNLAKHFPYYTFYMIGRSDIKQAKKAGIDIPENIVDIWDEFNPKGDVEIWDWPLHWIKENNIDLDCGIFMNGPQSVVSIPNKIWGVRDPSKHVKPMEMSKKYVAPIINVINEFNLPFFTVAPDLRYMKFGKDMIYLPPFVISQYNMKTKAKHFTSFDNQKELETVEIPVLYAGIEKTFFLDKDGPDFDHEKTEKFVVIQNECKNGARDRTPIVEEWICKPFPDAPIIGKYGNKPDGTPYYDNPQFEGPMDFPDLMDRLKGIKYTFIIPMFTGVFSSKCWEVVNYGVIPFLHPEVDDQGNLPFPDYLRVSSPEELKEKIEELENNPEKYNEIREQLRSLLTPELYNGKEQADMLEMAMNKAMKKVNG